MGRNDLMEFKALGFISQKSSWIEGRVSGYETHKKVHNETSVKSNQLVYQTDLIINLIKPIGHSIFLEEHMPHT